MKEVSSLQPSSWESKKISHHFIKAERSLPRSQQPAPGSYDEPDESSPRRLIMFI
jgi:hypothetical protein